MNETDFSLTSPDGTEVLGYRWTNAGAPKAIVQVAHGMGEHAARYRRLAEALTAAGYAVYANDHRGHGRTARTPDHHGDLGPGRWAGLVADLGEVSALARREHPGLPLAIVAHSMGSFALQRYLLDHSADLDAAVLTGTTAIDVIAPGIDPTQEVDLSAFNAPFAPNRTDADWLSRDDLEVDLYVADPACGFGLDANSVASMLEDAEDFADPIKLAGIRADLPILLVSGEADPLAGGGALGGARRFPLPRGRCRRCDRHPLPGRPPRGVQRDQPRRGHRPRHRLAGAGAGVTESAETLIEQIVEELAISHRITAYLLDACSDDCLATVLPKGWGPAAQFAHLHNVRLMWLDSAKEAHGLEKLATKGAAHGRGVLSESLERSGASIRDLVRRALTEGRRVPGFKPHTPAFAAYLVAHDAYHHGELGLICKEIGHPIDKRHAFGMWEWGSR